MPRGSKPKAPVDNLTAEEKLAIIIERVKPTPAVLALPHFPTRAQKQWWNKYIGQKFRDNIASKGKKSDNGVTWVHTIFVAEFCQEKYPQLTNIWKPGKCYISICFQMKEEREQYYQLVGERFYQYLTNHTNNGTTGVKVKATPVKTRAYGYDVWRREKPEEFEQMKTEFLKSHPKHNEKNVGSRRSLYSALFALLPVDVQKDYSIRASDALKVSQAFKLLFGEDRNQYNENITRRLKALMKEVDICAKSRIIAQVLTEDGDGNFQIHSVASENLREFQSSPEIARALNAMKDWVQSTVAKGKRVDGGAPNIAVYPDASKDDFPCLPNFAGATVAEAQKLLRVYITMIWMFMGGVGKVPWEEISQDVENWIDPERMPADAIWKDPGSQPLSAVLVWLDYFIGCQDGTIPAHKQFQFRRVVAGPHPIAPSLSQEASREHVRRNDKDTYLLVFEDTVTKCHYPGGMRYPESSQAYAVFLATGNSPSRPSRPDLLPTGGSAPTTLIDGDAKSKILEHAEQLPEDVGDLVRNLLDVLNTHQSHYPASNAEGPWADKSPLPALLPNTLPEDFPTALRNFILDDWLPICYFQAPAEPGDDSTIPWFEVWQRTMLATGALHHKPSGTMLGGHSGVVWVVAALIKLVLNFAALRGDIPHPVELPADCDTSRVPLGEWHRLLDWCRNWISKLEDDINILSQTSEERRKPVTDQVPVPSGPESAPALPDAPAPAQPVKSRKARPKIKKTPASKSRGADSDSEGQCDSTNLPSDSEGEENIDYERLDTHGDSDGLSCEGENSDTEPSFVSAGRDDDAWGAGDAPLLDLPPNPPSSRPLTPSGPTTAAEHVFGPFHSLLPLKKWPPLPKDYNSVFARVKKCNDEVNATLSSWYKLGAEKDKLAIKDAQGFATAPISLPEKWRPIVDFVWTATKAWQRASETAPAVFQLAHDFLRLIRDSVPYAAASRRFRDIAEIMGNDQDMTYLEEMETRLNRGLAELRWLSKELIAYEQLSSEWSAKLVTTWQLKAILKDASALHTFAMLLLQWGQASECLENSLIRSRESLWKELGGPLDEARSHMRLWYRFGCVSAPGRLESLKACLTAASAPDAPVVPVSSRAVSETVSTTGDDINVEDQDLNAQIGGLEVCSAQYVVSTDGTTIVPEDPATITRPSRPEIADSTLVASAPSPGPTPAASPTSPSPPSTDPATQQYDSVDTSPTEPKRKRQKVELLAPDAGPSTRRNTRSTKTTEPEPVNVPGKTRAAKRQAVAAKPAEVKRRKTGRK